VVILPLIARQHARAVSDPATAAAIADAQADASSSTIIVMDGLLTVTPPSRKVRSLRSCVTFDEPLIARSVESVPMLDERLDAYRREGIDSERLLSTIADLAGRTPSAA